MLSPNYNAGICFLFEISILNQVCCSKPVMLLEKYPTDMFKSLLVVKHNKILEKTTIAIFKEKTKKI